MARLERGEENLKFSALKPLRERNSESDLAAEGLQSSLSSHRTDLFWISMYCGFHMAWIV